MKKFFNQSVKMALAISAAVLVSQQGFARSSSGDGVLLSLNPMYSTQKADTTGVSTSTTETNKTLLDLNLGYQMGNGLYLGLLYLTDSIESKSGTPTTTTKSTVSGYGPSVGYMKNGWFGHFHYILSSEYDNDTADADKWTKGTGMQLDFGYLMPVSGPFALGVEMSYRSIEYGTFNFAGTDVTTSKIKFTEMMPRLRFTFIF